MVSPSGKTEQEYAARGSSGGQRIWNGPLSGLSDSDLMDMLSGDEDLSDLGDMLSSQSRDGKLLEELFRR